MRYYNSILETIGNTPLVRLPRIAKDAKCLFLAKLEMFNPGGSVKVRIGVAMIEDAERKGLLKPGGTISGVGKFLKEKNPKVKVIGADPIGSILKDYFATKKLLKGHPYKIEGIGEDFIPETTWFEYVDDIVKVGDKEAYLLTRRLAREEGILAGRSAGAALFAALKIA